MLSYPAEEGLLWPFTCATCGIEFVNKPSKNNHMITVHQTGTQRNPTEFDEFKALPEGTNRVMSWLGEECLFTSVIRFANKPSENNHTITTVHWNDDRFTCDLCHKSILKTNFRRHLRAHELQNGRRFHCGACKKDYSSKWYLKQHLKSSAHTERTQCKLCEKSVKIQSLEWHMMREHFVYPIEFNPMELNSMGINSMEINPMGINSMEINPMEFDPKGINSMGIDSIEINSMEINPIGISSLIPRTPNRSSSLALFVDEYAPVRDLDVDVIVIDD